MLKTRDGQMVQIETLDKPGMSIFKVFGRLGLEEKPCHWSSDGRYRMDGSEHPLDIINFDRAGTVWLAQ